MEDQTGVKLDVPIEEVVSKLEHLSADERAKWEEKIKSAKGLSWEDIKEIVLLKTKSFGLFKMPFYFKLSLTAFVCVLAVGYAMSVTNVFFCTPIDKDIGIIASIGQRYTGSGGKTKLENKINSTMKYYLKSEEERALIMNWLDAGATKAAYPTIEPVIQKRCIACHISFAPLTNYENVSKFTGSDSGMSVQFLTKVSHVHIFGMATFFIFITVIFGFTRFNFYIKTVIMPLPFVAIFLDILSFWLTKYNANFAIMIIIAGGMMGISFAFLFVGTLYDIWLRRETKVGIC